MNAGGEPLDGAAAGLLVVLVSFAAQAVSSRPRLGLEAGLLSIGAGLLLAAAAAAAAAGLGLGLFSGDEAGSKSGLLVSTVVSPAALVSLDIVAVSPGLGLGKLSSDAAGFLLTAAAAAAGLGLGLLSGDEGGAESGLVVGAVAGVPAVVFPALLVTLYAVSLWKLGPLSGAAARVSTAGLLLDVVFGLSVMVVALLPVLPPPVLLACSKERRRPDDAGCTAAAENHKTTKRAELLLSWLGDGS